MKVAPLFVVLFVAATFAQQPGSPKGKVVTVQIIVATLDAHTAACQNKKVPPTAVLVTGKAVRHCVEGKLLNHDDEKANPGAFKATLVQLSAGDSVQWTSETPFRVFQLVRHAPIQGGAPAYPFIEALPTSFSKSVTVGPVIDLARDIVQQYKVSFEIEKPGNRVDPDIVCSM